MTEDWGRYFEEAGTKSDEQLEVEVETPDSLGGSAQMRAAAKVEIKKRDRKAAEHLADKQLAIADQHARSARSAVRAARASVAVTALAALASVVNVWLAYHAR